MNYGTFSVDTRHQQVCALGRIQKYDFFFVLAGGVVSVQYWGLRTVSLCFVHDVVQLASLDCDLECTLGCFAAECEAAGMRVSASRSEALALSSVDCSQRSGGLVIWYTGHFPGELLLHGQ